MKKLLCHESIDAAVFLIISLLVLAAGIVIGSVYLMSLENTEGISGFLKSYMESISGGVDKFSVFKNAFAHNMLLLLLMFAAGFFKAGFILIGACMVRKGFVMGFTTAAFYRLFGIKGIFMGMAYLPAVLTAIPAILFYAALSGSLSLSNDKKKFLFYYIFVTIFIITIFCGSSFLEGYVTTIFMKSASGIL